MDIVYIKSPHNAENIANSNGTVIGQYGLNTEDIFKTVCDNASNTKKAFKVSLWEEEKSNNAEDGLFKDDELEIAVNSEEEYQEMNADYAAVFRETYRIPCTIHTLQLFVKDMLVALLESYKNS